MSVTQLNPPLPMSCPKGEGFAHFLIDYGPESDLYWTIFITETGEVWTYANKHVRASKNVTLGRTLAKVPQAAPSLDPVPSSLDVVLSAEAGVRPMQVEDDAPYRTRLAAHLATRASTTYDRTRTLLASGAELDAIGARYGTPRLAEFLQL